MPSKSIICSNLSRSFGPINAVSNLNITIHRGELYGLVGPDGSGKTTTMRLLAGIMEPTDGDALVAGFSVRTDPEEVKARIGYMSQRFGLYEDLTVMENILFYADLYNVPGRERNERINRLLAFSNLEPFQRRLAGALSGGMKQKLGLACALVHTPEVLLLDEPTNGVDPVSRRDFWRILYDLLREGVTILLSTSYLDEAERCTRIGLIHRGRIILEGDPLKVRSSFDAPMLELWPDRVREAGIVARKMEGVQEVTVYGDRLHITLERSAQPAAVVDGIRRSGIEVLEHRDILPSLEDVFIASVRGT
jgi:ABC-2 type transport system ATP-binding protein